MFASKRERRADLEHIGVRALVTYQNEILPHMVENAFECRISDP